ANTKGVVYPGKDKQKMLMRAEVIHRFRDGTLNKVYDKIDVMLRDNRLGYGNRGLEDHKWPRKDKERTESMLIKIEKMLRERQRMRSFEYFVRGKRNKIDYRLLVRPE
ncbi:hypothetical protein Tco_0825022, partial [Tanacetum coccineum]